MKIRNLIFLVVWLLLFTLPIICFAQLAPAPQNYVLQFGGDDVAFAPQSNLLNLGSQFTMETWIYLNGQSSPYPSLIMGKVFPGGDPFLHYALQIPPNGKLEFVQTTGQAGSYRSILSPSPMPANQWLHVAATLQGTQMRLFINGQQVAAGNSVGSPAPAADVPFALGAGLQSFGGQPAAGLYAVLRQARVWNRALSEAEISTNASRRMNAGESGLIAQWMMEEGSGQTVQDSSGNNLTLQLGTSPVFDNNDPRWLLTIIFDPNPYFTLERFQIAPNTTYLPEAKLFDFDSDGDLDVLDFRSFNPDLTGPAIAMRNNGQGIYSDATAAVFGMQNTQTASPRHFAIADFNGDGRKDIFVADHGRDAPPFPGGQSRIFMQTADGKLLDETVSRLPIKNAFTHHVSATDIEGDGDIDLYLANLGSSQPVVPPELYINDGSGHFTANTSRLPTFLTTFQRKYTASAFVDLNGDNRPELILGAHPGALWGGLRDTILMNDGNGNFTSVAPENALPPRGGGSTWGTMSIEPADFNNDGKVDLLLSIAETNYNGGRVQLLLNNGDGTFRDGSETIQQPQLPTNVSFSWIIWSFPGDFNNDGKMDFVISPNHEHPHLYLNLGQARFADYTGLLGFVTVDTKAYPGDLDNDGDTDIFMASSWGNYAVIRNQRPFVIGSKPFDFDGDGKSDVSVFRPSNGSWYLLQSQNGFTGAQFGASSDRIAPADYDGDGKTDFAVYRNGTWYLQRSQAGFTGISFGASTDVPMPADMSGDGRAELVVFRPSDGGWYVYNLASNQFTAVQFGQTGDIPVAADYDGDGKSDIAVYRNGTWYINRSQLGFTGISFGEGTDKPVPADYDGDGKIDLAVFRHSTGSWYLLRSQLGFTGVQFGTSGDKPVAADYDGDGKADVAVFRNGAWYIQRSTQGFTGVSFGDTTDKPIPGAFVP